MAKSWHMQMKKISKYISDIHLEKDFEFIFIKIFILILDLHL